MRLKWPVFCIFALLITCLTFVLNSSFAQCCTPPSPTFEISEVTPVQFPGTISQFKMHIGDANVGDPSATNFNGMYVQEEYGNQGTNSCYYENGPLPQHPVVSNPESGVPPWVVGTLNDGTAQPDYWGYDLIGVTQDAIDILRRERSDLASGCALVVFQDMWISCGQGHPNYYERNNVLQMFIRMAEVENCRKAVLDSSNRCERLPYQTP